MRIAETLIIGIGTSGQNICEKVANNLSYKYGDYKKASWVGIKVLETAPKYALDNVDYVLVGRYDTAGCPFENLRTDIIRAFKKINKEIRQDNSNDEKVTDSAD